MADQAERLDDNVIQMAEAVHRLDVWQNNVTGLGVFGRDKTRHDFFTRPRDFTQTELEDLYRGDSIAARIVDVLPHDMLRQWFELKIGEMTRGEEADPEQANEIAAYVQHRHREIKSRHKIGRGLRWDRLYGGSIVMMLIDDGREMDQPVDTTAIKKVHALHALHRFKVTEGPLSTDPTSPHFGSPEFYTVQLDQLSNAQIFPVHADRVLRFQDVDIPEDARRRQIDHFGDSVFVRCWEALSDFQMAYRAVAQLMADFSQAVWEIPDLHKMLLAKKEDLIQRRIGIMDFSRSVANAVMIDSKIGEKFHREATPVNGMAELLDREGIRLSAATGMPITLLLGIAPKGFANEDASGEANWDDVVASKQQTNLHDQMFRLCHYLMLEEDSPIDVEPDTWGLEFNPLTQPTAEQQAALEKTVAETDKIRIDSKVLDAFEVRMSRYTSDGFSQDTNLEETVTEQMREKLEAADEPDPVPPPPPPAGSPPPGVEGGENPADTQQSLQQPQPGAEESAEEAEDQAQT